MDLQRQISSAAIHPASTELSLSAGLKLPWPARQNPSHLAHEARARTAATEVGLLRPNAPPADSRRFEAFVSADGWAYPTALEARLHAAGGFNQWLYFLDDQYDDNPMFGRDLEAVERLFDRTFAILGSGRLTDQPTPFDLWTYEVRRRLEELAPAGWLLRFLADAHDYLFRGSLSAMALWASGRTLGVEEYMHLRLYDSSLYAVFDVLELAVDAPFSQAMLESPLLRELRILAARHVAFANDLYSYHKECIRYGSRFNLLHVLQADRGLPLAGAVTEAFALLERDVDRFVAIEAALPDTTPEEAAATARYIDGLKGWMAGNVAFSSMSERFRAPDAVFADLRS